MINDFLLINDKRLSVYIFYELVFILQKSVLFSKCCKNIIVAQMYNQLYV